MLLKLLSLLSFDDILGQTYAKYVIAIAGAESIIGLGILVAFYRIHSFLILFCLFYGKKTYYLPCIYVLPTRGINCRKRIVTSYVTNYFKNYSA